MIVLLLYLGLILCILVTFLVIAFVTFGLYVDILGAPFVPTSRKVIGEILKKAKLKKGQIFLELGSGDGRIIRSAVKNYQVKGIGIDLHPMLIFYSRLISKFQKIKNISFKRQNLFKTDLSKADVIFLFLLPKTLKRLAPKFILETKKNTLIISHGFKIPEFEKYLTNKIVREIFSTYYYRIT